MKAYTQDIITLWYRPPEILLQSRKYKGEVDLWSIGCIIAELIMLKPLYMGRNEEE
jgi:serine/threonine protein kinase